MTLSDYLRMLRQQWSLVFAVTLLSGSCACAYSFVVSPTYRASAQIFVSTQGGGTIGDLSQGSSFTQQRVKSYTDLASSPRLLQPVITSLGLPMTPSKLASQVSANSPLDTVLINITVVDPDPVRARNIANAVADTYPILVAELETPPGEVKSLVHVSRTKSAITPAEPVSPRISLNVLLGLLVGLALGVGVGILRSSLDKTIKSRENAHQIAQAPVMTTVGEDPDAEEHPLITRDAFSPRAEAFRQLRTNLRFLSVDRRVGSLVVTSAIAHEGKSTTSANLAIVLAQAGESVVLIDADLRRPTIAEIFALSSGVGLTSVLIGDLELEDALQSWRDDLPLKVLTSGPLPPNPAELIGSAQMASLVERLTEAGMTVVLDSPPLLPVTDAALLARATDGALIVTRAAKAHADQLAAACDALRIAGATLLGVVLNRLPRKGNGAYSGAYAAEGYYAYQRVSQERSPLPASPQTGRANAAQAAPSASAAVAHSMLSVPSTRRINPATGRAGPSGSEPERVLSVGRPISASSSALPTDPGLRMVLPPPELADPGPCLPDTANSASGVGAHRSSPAPLLQRPRTATRRAAHVTQSEPDIVIDSDAGTYSRLELSTEAPWHAEWGELPSPTARQARGEANGDRQYGRAATGARHRN